MDSLAKFTPPSSPPIVRRHHVSAGDIPVFAGRAALLFGTVFLLASPLLLGANALQTGTQFLCLVTVALMWNLLAGYADILTLGQHMFVGIGAYAFFGLAGPAGVPPLVAIAGSGVAALLFALPVMFVVFRLRAAYLAVGTWVVAEVFMLIAGRLPGFGLGTGISLPLGIAKVFGSDPASRAASIYMLALIVTAAAFGLTGFCCVLGWASD
jgi:branched-chain amino acid transport system permease protein